MDRPASPAPDLPDRLYFRIGEVAELVGVESHVLRYWEGEFRIRPHRSVSGHRMYRREDIERFLQIRNLLHDEGFTIAGARKVLSGEGEGRAPNELDPIALRDIVQRLAALERRLAALRQEALDSPILRGETG